MERDLADGASGHMITVLPITLHISAKFELAMFEVVQLEAGDNGTGTQNGRYAVAGGKALSQKLLEYTISIITRGGIWWNGSML